MPKHLIAANPALTPGTYNSANVTITADGRITAIAAGSGGGGTWGSITGDINTQTDLNTKFGNYVLKAGDTMTGGLTIQGDLLVRPDALWSSGDVATSYLGNTNTYIRNAFGGAFTIRADADVVFNAASGTQTFNLQTASTSRLFVTNVGRVGVNVGPGLTVTSPVNQLHVYTGPNDGIRIQSSGDGPTLFLQGSTSTSKITASFNGDTLDFVSGNQNTAGINQGAAARFGQAGLSWDATDANSTTTMRQGGDYTQIVKWWDGTTAQYANLIVQPKMYAAGTTPSYAMNLRIGSSDLMTLRNTNGAYAVGILTTAPTHSLTLSSSTTGLAFHNNADQTVNYNRLRMYYNANVFTINAEAAGSATVADLQIGISSRQIFIANTSSNLGGYRFIGGSTANAGAVGIVSTYTTTASSGIFVGNQMTYTSNGSGTAGYTGLQVNLIETSVGSGAKLLADFQVGGTSKFSIANDGTLTNASLAGTGTRMVVASSTGVLSTQAIASGSGATITSNTVRVDQNPAGGSYGTLAGLVNGTNALFTVANGSYQSGTLQVMLNGQDQTQGASNDFVETAPGSGTFTFNIAPPTGSIIKVSYTMPNTSTGNFAMPYSVKTSAHTLTMADDFDMNNATGGAYNVTPYATTTPGIPFTVKKVDASANAVTVVGTFDGATNYVLSTQNKYVTFITTTTSGTFYVVGNN